MRLMVFFDLPTKTKRDRKLANDFRKFLIKDGYYMVQLSVYSRICKGLDTAEKHARRLKANTPEYGCVRLLMVTEKQYSSMEILVGIPKKEEALGVFALLEL